MADEKIPEWVAPKGAIDPRLTLGVYVRAKARLVASGDVASGWAGWTREEIEPTEAVVCGIRFVYSGRYRPGRHYRSPLDGEQERAVTHRAYLVASDMRRKHWLALAQDMEIDEPRRRSGVRGSHAERA